MQLTPAIDGNVALDAQDLFSCVIAFEVCAVGVFDALRINDQKARHGAACMPGTSRNGTLY